MEIDPEKYHSLLELHRCSLELALYLIEHPEAITPEDVGRLKQSLVVVLSQMPRH